MSFSKVYLSGSTNGRPVAVAATSSPGTTIHTAHASAMDEVFIYATNTDIVDRLVTVQFGGTGAGDSIEATIPAGKTELVIPGSPLTGALVVKAYAAAASVVNVFGYVNRIA